MLAGEVARQVGVTVRALRYYELMGLVVPSRKTNGYRWYGAHEIRLIEEIKTLVGLGLTVEETRPFLDCLSSGHDAGDACPASLATYRKAIRKLGQQIEQLTNRRELLVVHLEAAAQRSMGGARSGPTQAWAFPAGVVEHPPADQSDDVVGRLQGSPMPSLALTATSGDVMWLDALGEGRTVLYVYPLTGRPGVDLPEGWDSIPGARGCTVEACGFRDHYVELVEAGARQVFGLSSQSRDYQRELVDRLRLPFDMLSDEQFALAQAMGLPTFAAGALRLYTRLTLIIYGGVVEKVFYPVSAPGPHAAQVLEWLRSRGARSWMPAGDD
jgi:peroxiredoxin/DNA-binding transcriptional MerR regulator